MMQATVQHQPHQPDLFIPALLLGAMEIARRGDAVQR
jgi:hypothetical protein